MLSEFGSMEHLRMANEYRPEGMIDANEMAEKLNSRLQTNRFSDMDVRLCADAVKPDFIAREPYAPDVTGDGKPDPDKCGEPFWKPERVGEFVADMKKNKWLFEHEIQVADAKAFNDEWDAKLGYKRQK